MDVVDGGCPFACRLLLDRGGVGGVAECVLQLKNNKVDYVQLNCHYYDGSLTQSVIHLDVDFYEGHSSEIRVERKMECWCLS